MNRVIGKVSDKESKIFLKMIGKREDLCMIGISDASYHSDTNSVYGDTSLL